MRPLLDTRAYLGTRGSLILLGITVALVAASAALGGLIQPSVFDNGMATIEITAAAVYLPLSIMVPIIAVLMIAGEWSDRSIQVTFLQRPGRTGVLVSKVLATLGVVAAIVAASAALAVLATWVGGDLLGEGTIFSSWDSALATQLSVIVAALAFAIAMGLALQSTVLGLIAALGVPFVVSAASAVAMLTGSELIADIIRAVDLNAAAMAIGSGDGAAFDLIPVALLIVVPAAIGVWRWNSREVG